jgi:steroid delta-isomerase-like uncharacterized protein
MRRLTIVPPLLALTVALILVGAIAPPLAAQEASPAASPAALPPLLEAWLAAFNAGDTERLLTLFTEDGLWEELAIGLDVRGQDAIRAHLERLFTAAPDIAYEVTSSVVAGDRAVVEWVATCTYRADFPGLPPAADQPFSFRGASVFEMTDGKIRRYTEYWDAYAFLVQLGALPAPAAAGTPTG